jgi:hypothetical protein
MKTQATKGIMILLLIILFVPFVGFAQDNEKPNIVTTVTLTFDTDADGSPAEFDSLTAIFDKNVVSKNKFVKSVMRVFHYYGSSSGEYIIITEYNGSGLAIIEKAGEEGFELFKKWKKDEDDREAFNKARNKYFMPGHSDEIYTLISKVSN